MTTIARKVTPYHNLILTGYMGLGKVAVGRLIADKLNVQFVDLETEIQLREGLPADEIRQLYGESRLRTLEDELCRELALRRGSVLSIGAQALLDPTNRERLLNSGTVLVLTCSLNEILRRFHASQGTRFHDPKVRATAINGVRRERQIHQIPGLASLDTTQLSIEAVAERAVQFWLEKETVAE